MSKHKQREIDNNSRKVVHPKDCLQKQVMFSIIDNSVTVINGPAGSGKTLLCIYQLYQLLKSRNIDKIYIVRLIVETNDEKLGALPGEKDEKLQHFLGPIADNLSEFLPFGEVEYLFNNKLIEVIPVSHCRGRSFKNKGIIVEESQNLSPEQIVTIATRISDNTKLIFNGDDAQSDIFGRKGMGYLSLLFKNMPDASVINLGQNNIYRHLLISKILSRALTLKT